MQGIQSGRIIVAACAALLVMGCVMHCAGEEAPAGKKEALEADTRLPVPPAALLGETEKRIREALKEEYAKRGAADRIALAQRLLKIAEENKEDAPVRYAALREAKDIAAAAGDSAIALAAAEALSAVFKVNKDDLKLAAFTVVARAAATAEDADKALTAGDGLLSALAGEASFEAALKLAPQLEDLARKARNAEALKTIQLRSKELRGQQTEWNKVKPMLDKLAANPDDPEANLAVGRFACFAKGDWDKGLPLLLKGSDAALKALAEKDLAKPAAAADAAALGDAWADYADKQLGTAKACIQGRAKDFYERALPELSGVAKLKVEKRLDGLAGAPSSRIDLLALADPVKSAIAGTWKAEGRALVSDAGACSRVMLPYEVPDEYDYRVDFTRNSGNSTVGLILTKGGHEFAMETGWPAGQTGFTRVNGQHIDANPTGTHFPLTNGRRYSFVVQVRNTGLRLLVDGKPIITWKTDYKNVTPHAPWALPNKQCLGFGSFASPTTFHAAELIEVTGKGKRLR
ncbi:MAG: hypothetical protein ABSE73_07700 [Planctomycetota bacterium]